MALSSVFTVVVVTVWFGMKWWEVSTFRRVHFFFKYLVTMPTADTEVLCRV